MLVVEDDPVIALELAAMLSRAGFAVVGPFASVAAALASLRAAGCQLALLDTNLGAETAEPIARALSASGTPFIVLSGYSREQQPPAMRDAPLLVKPVQPAQLLAEIARQMAAAAAAGASVGEG